MWNSLPVEMKLAVVHSLDVHDLTTFSKVDLEAYSLCVPTTFRSVKLNSAESLRRFLHNVPRTYFRHIRHLEVCTKTTSQMDWGVDHPCTDALVSLLSHCYCLEQLSLQLAGSLAKHIIPVFSNLDKLKILSIVNCGDEESTPISERLVVCIAASITGLEQLSLDRISRSAVHAPELVGIHPHVPLVTGDEDIPDHPILGSELFLPSLLRIPSLRRLVIRDTHLGDPSWATTPVDCRLEAVDLGSCYHENDNYNRICAERIIKHVGPTIDALSLATAVSDSIFTISSATPLQRLRKLHITPYFPVNSLVETITALSGSPIESLSIQCYEEDVGEMCTALEDFLSLRVDRGPEFYSKLTRIDLSITTCDISCAKLEENTEGAEAASRLQEFCWDLDLSSDIADIFHQEDLPCRINRGSRCGDKLPVSTDKNEDGCLKELEIFIRRPRVA